MTQAGQLYRSQQYSIAMYLAGVAVECMLRAFHFDREFDDRHNIELMFGACDSEKELHDASNARITVGVERWQQI